MTARHMVLRTSKLDATAADIERWAADRGCIVTNIRRIADDALIEYEGRMVRPSDTEHIWTADIVASEGIE